jgi:hypothetical protein
MPIFEKNSSANLRQEVTAQSAHPWPKHLSGKKGFPCPVNGLSGNFPDNFFSSFWIVTASGSGETAVTHSGSKCIRALRNPMSRSTS